MSILYGIIFVLNIIACVIPLAIMVKAIHKSPSDGLTNYLIICMCIFINSVGTFSIFISNDAESALIGAKIAGLAKVCCLCALTEFVSEYCGFKVQKGLKVFTIIMDLLVIAGLYTTATYQKYYVSYDLVTKNSIPIWTFESGICYYLYLIVIFYTMGGLIFEIIKKIVENKEKEEQRKHTVILIGLLTPIIACILNLLIKPLQYDIIPFGLVIASVLFYVGMEKYEIFDLSQNVKEYVLDHSVEAIMVVDVNKNLLYENEVVKQSVPNLVLYKPMLEEYEYFLEKEQQEFEYGEMHFSVQRTLIETNKKELQGYLIEVRDETEKYKKKQHMNELMEEAEMANQAKSTFLTHMSHEIRAPINVVLGMDEMIIRETENEEVLDYAENIQTAGKTLLSIINDILDFTKIESGELEIVPEKYDVKEILDNAKRMVMPRLEGKDILFDMQMNPDIPRMLLGDSNRIQQAMINILTNAAKYTQKGSIVVKVEFEKRDFTDNGPEILLRFSVKDTGMGIREEDLKKLFHSFQRIEEEKNRNIEGTGLGLTITQRLIQKMGGQILVESEYGKGSTFTIELPQIVMDFTGIGYEREGKERNKKKYQEKFHAPKAKILVVDDNLVNIKVLQGLLKKTKVQITAVDSGKKCLREVEKNHYDLIFMDHMMPEMDGVETFKTMKEMEVTQCRNTPVISLTANAIQGAREMYLQIGFSDYLMKPVNYEELENMMIQFLPKEYIELVE